MFGFLVSAAEIVNQTRVALFLLFVGSALANRRRKCRLACVLRIQLGDVALVVRAGGGELQRWTTRTSSPCRR
jgi:hypothetical protein